MTVLHDVEVKVTAKRDVAVCDADGCEERKEGFFKHGDVPDGWVQATIEDSESINSEKWTGKYIVKVFCPKHKVSLKVE